MNIKDDDGNINIKILIPIILVIILSILICVIIFRKDDQNTQMASSINYEYFTLYSSEDEKIGVVNKKGEKIIEPEYVQIYIPNQEKDLFICFTDEQYTILDSKKRELFEEFEDVFVLMISEETLEMEKNVLGYKENGKYGLIDLSGKKLTEPIYESIRSLKNKPGNLLVKKDGLYGVLNENGEVIIPEKYNTIKSDEFSSETEGYTKTGYIISEKTKTGIIYGYIDYAGKVLIKPKYESIARATEYQEEDIYLIVMANGKKGVFKNKKQIIKNKYQSINYYDTSNIFIVNRNGKFGFYNNSGKEILGTKYTSYSLAGNYIFVKKDETAELYDIHGNLVNSNNYRSIIETGNPSFFIAEDEAGYYSIISKDSKIDNKYTNISYAFDNFFIFTTEEGKSGVLNVYTGIEIEPEYDSILLTGTVNALEARKGNIVDIYSRNIEKILTMRDGIVENIGKDYLVIHSKNELAYIDKQGELTSNTVVFPNLKLYSIKEDDKWGFADSQGKIVVNCEYDIVTELNEYGFAGIYKDGKWGVVNEKGKIIVEPSYELETYYSPQFIGKYKLEELDNLHCIEITE